MSISCQIHSLFKHDACDCFILLHENGLKWTLVLFWCSFTEDSGCILKARDGDKPMIESGFVGNDLCTFKALHFMFRVFFIQLPGGTLAMLSSVTTMMQAPCGTPFLWVTQAYSTPAFPSTGYRNTGEPTAGEPVTVSTCRIPTASRGKLKDRGSLVGKSCAEPPGKWWRWNTV